MFLWLHALSAGMFICHLGGCPEVWYERVEDEGRDDDTILKRYVKAVEGEQVCWGLSRDDVMAPKIANQSPSHILMKPQARIGHESQTPSMDSVIQNCCPRTDE